MQKNSVNDFYGMSNELPAGPNAIWFSQSSVWSLGRWKPGRTSTANSIGFDSWFQNLELTLSGSRDWEKECTFCYAYRTLNARSCECLHQSILRAMVLGSHTWPCFLPWKNQNWLLDLSSEGKYLVQCWGNWMPWTLSIYGGDAPTWMQWAAPMGSNALSIALPF